MVDQHLDVRTRWRAWASSPEGIDALDRALVDAVARLARDLRHEPPPRFADRIPLVPAPAVPAAR